jgi:hypothetical protein
MLKRKKELLSHAYWRGFFSVFDLWRTSNRHEAYKYNPDNLSPEELDYEATKEDWEMVGQDLKYSINHYGQEK